MPFQLNTFALAINNVSDVRGNILTGVFWQEHSDDDSL